MPVTIPQTLAHKTYTANIAKTNPFSAFTAWCANQQENRLLWLSIALAGQGCVLTPITLVASMWYGIDMTFYSIAVAAIVMNVIVNLAALPTKITIPVLFFSVLLNIVVIIAGLL